MNKYSELQYIGRLGLVSLQKVQSGYTCNCFKCGSATPWKRKMYILTEHRNYITVFCQRCGYNTNLRNFIRDINPYIFEEYKKEEAKERLDDLRNGTLNKKMVGSSVINTDIDLKYLFKLSSLYFKPAKQFRKAVEFCKRRHIQDHIDEFYYSIHPTDNIMSGMLIFPFYMEDKETLYGFQGRHTEQKLFYTHSKNESVKSYNTFNVDYEQTVFIFESIIDSLMVENSIAMLGTSLSEAIKALMHKRVWIFDNDRVGKQRALQYLDQGEKCFIYPDNFKWKDFNEAVCAGYKRENLPRLIQENSCDALKGKTKLMFQLMNTKR